MNSTKETIITVIAYRENTEADRDYGPDHSTKSNLKIASFKSREKALDYLINVEAQKRFHNIVTRNYDYDYECSILINGQVGNSNSYYEDYSDCDFNAFETDFILELITESQEKAKLLTIELIDKDKEIKRIAKKKEETQRKEDVRKEELKLLAKLQAKYKEVV